MMIVDLSTATMEQLDNMLNPKCTLCGKDVMSPVSLAQECQCSSRCRYCLQLFCSDSWHQKMLDGAFDNEGLD